MISTGRRDGVGHDAHSRVDVERFCLFDVSGRQHQIVTDAPIFGMGQMRHTAGAAGTSGDGRISSAARAR